MATIILDPHWRAMDELFSEESRARLAAHRVVWGKDAPIPEAEMAAALPEAEVLIAADPRVDAALLERAPKLRAVIEVSGAFPDTIDYAACAARGVEVLSCAPGFRRAVAEMGLAMALAGARGLVTEHEAFRRGEEGWLQDNPVTDFTLFGARVGFVGYGQIARELAGVLAPFRPEIRAHDPWLSEADVPLMPLHDLAGWARCLFVTAAPTAENRGFIDGDVLARMPDHALLVILSRAHLVDFDAVTEAAASGRIRVATDVFPSEPLAADHPIRTLPNVILSPHRAAAVDRGRQLIGEMILDDIDALFAGRADRRLTRADPARIAALTGVSDAASVAAMAAERE